MYHQRTSLSRSHVLGIATILCFTGLSLHYLGLSPFPSSFERRNQAQTYDANFPRKIWQTWDQFPQDMDEENQRLSKTWTDLNREYRYELLTNDSATTFVQDHFKHRPDIVHTFERLDDPILRADLLRYLTLLAEGGVYTDLDTDCTRPIRDWIPEELLNASNVVLGIEYDAQGGEPRAEFKAPSELCQWTMMSKPNHPVIQHIVDRVIERLVVLGAGRRTIAAHSIDDILNVTGPRMFTIAALEALSMTTGKTVSHEDLSGIFSPKLFGDVLVLPVSAFASGQDHSGSKAWGNNEQLMSHHWKGGPGWVTRLNVEED